MTKDSIPFAVPDVGDAEAEAVARAIRSGWVTSGPEMRAFESEFADFLGGGVEVVAVNSATAGLHLALEAIGIGPGDEVIVPDWTFTSTAEVVRYLGATPVIVDVDRASLNIDLDSVVNALTPQTRAIIVVHFAGLAVDLVALRGVLGVGQIAIVEDAAHALPAIGAAGFVGSGTYSDATVFSFYATKTITTGEGGLLATRDPQIAARSRIMRLHGIDRDAFDRYRSSSPAWAYDVVAPGFKYNMPDTAAAMGRVQLARADEMRDRRQRIADYYTAEFQGLPVRLPTCAHGDMVHAWHLYVIRPSSASPIDRDGLIAGMAAQGIGASVHFIPLHEHTYWRAFTSNAASTLPVAHAEGPLAVSLPLFSRMTDSQVERVADSVKGLLT